MTNLITENARLRAALEACISMLDDLVVESGRGIEYGEEDAFRMGEWFDDHDLGNIDTARAALTTPAPDAVQEAARVFDSADWYWRTMDPDDCGDSPEEAISRAMLGNFCICEIASSFTGPIRYGFTAPVLDADSDDEEFLHFATQQEAIDAAKERQAALRAIAGDRT